MPEGYCMKCHMARQMKDAHEEILKNGKPALVGKCEKCGTKMVKFIKGSKASKPAKKGAFVRRGGASKRKSSKTKRSSRKSKR